MNTETPSKANREPHAVSETPESVIALILQIPADLVDENIIPPGNKVGLLMLIEILTQAFEINGIKLFGVGGAGEGLNRCAMMLRVGSLQALEVVLGKMQRLVLIDFAWIAHFDGRELIWRAYHPKDLPPDLFRTFLDQIHAENGIGND